MRKNSVVDAVKDVLDESAVKDVSDEVMVRYNSAEDAVKYVLDEDAVSGKVVERAEISSGLYCINLLFGWMITGRVSVFSRNELESVYLLLITNDYPGYYKSGLT